MEITGKIIVAMPEVGGTSAKGNAWKKREYVLETQETYPKKVFFNFFGDRVDQFPLQVGQVVKISFDIDSREYNGRWYVDVRAWKAEDPGAAAPAVPQPGMAAPAAYGPAPQMPGGYAQPGAPVPPPAVDLAPSPTDDLPF
ncbi:MAG: DUF3127 domain-containing protein [Duncaniella sp.]|nr:DUF3127 domain-containing protein [Duncaniella sp.]MDE6065852.1 DUF3127 domain-containing protein [Duncaniella sp.]